MKTYREREKIMSGTTRGPKEMAGKLHWEYFPFNEAKDVVRVFEYGVKKYGSPFTYRAGIPEPELLAAIVRHAVAMLNGNSIDEESGLPHAAHICANGLMLMSEKTSQRLIER
jgi:hypothetical protein